MNGIRCFLALELQPHMVSTLLAAGRAFRAADPGWAEEKWVAEENLHITLKFLGALSPDQIGGLVHALGRTFPSQPSFSLELAGVRALPSARHCSMAWASFVDTEDVRCASLASKVDELTGEFGVDPDTRRFTPHVTLVRARKPHALVPEAIARANEALSCSDTPMSVRCATLFASTLTSRGPVYDRLARWDLLPGERRPAP